jgi:hypothetical protein
LPKLIFFLLTPDTLLINNSLSLIDIVFQRAIITFLSTDQWNESSEVTSGLQFLGYPVGSRTFAKQFIDKAITKFSTLTTKFKTTKKMVLFCLGGLPVLKWSG